ncbi:hypothetical protein C7N43_20140 [Sphingobacteriales bacterium UPWRP_1]|nr:hypothetical protein BVG80_02535 [Sphingobacteriales bacterium TSM_CSM]PSJ75231.1 hypothetical protein C7N43_20140 [Sphingobacteriales bacterium UPWRP_1]
MLPLELPQVAAIILPMLILGPLISGTVTVTVSGGTSPYTYTWSNGAATEDLVGVAAGSYDVTITDANGCVVTTGGSVNNIGGPTASTVPADATCGNADGSVTVTVSGGTSPYTYTWSNGAATEDLVGVAAGSYDVTITDANGCVVVSSAVVNNIAGPDATILLENANCGNANGSINLTVTGGTLPYLYIWSNGAATEDLSGLAAGDYSVTVSDANGCTVLLSANISNTPVPAITATAVDAIGGNANGSIDISISGGIPAYDYNWSNGATTEDLSNVAAGTYSVTVTDSNGCTATLTITVGNISCITAIFTATDATCGNANGEINITVSGGTLPYVYNWSNGATTEDLTGLAPGVYSVTITDANNCETTLTATIEDAETATAAFTGPDGICLGETATFTFTGTAPAGTVFNWNFGSAGQLTGPGPHTVTWNTAGVETVTLTVTDANGCTDIYTQTILISTVNVTATIEPGGMIAPGDTVLLSANAIALPGSTVVYEWTASSGTIDCSSCPETIAIPSEYNTIYTVTATDSLGCDASASVSVTWMYEKYVTIPNAFSPNADGRNDIFRLVGINIASFELHIYDRWGGNMFSIEDTDIGKGWDGKHKGIDCELGVYVYYAFVTFTDGTTQKLKGNVTLIR